jgi:hypothetical protein
MRQPAPKMLSHLENALADGLHVTQVAERSLAKS